MTKSELIAKLAAQYPHLLVENAAHIVTAILDAMSTNLASGRRIGLRGFGSSRLNFRQPRIGRDPKTAEAVHVLGTYRPLFKSSKKLRERVNDGKRRK